MPAPGAPARTAPGIDAVVGRRARTPGWLVPAVIGVLTAAAIWLRLPAHARGVLWAEDAMEFVDRAVDPGFWSSLFLPYQGYLQFVPRVAAGAVTWLLPVSAWAVGITAAAALITGAVCALIFVVAADIVTWAPARVLLAVTPALVPLGAWEVAGTLNNVHSVLLCAAPWLLLHRPRSRAAAILLAAVACAIVLSEPQAGYFLPLLLWRLRDRRRWLVRAGYLLGLAAQILAFVLAPRDIPAQLSIAPSSTVIGFFANAVLGTAFSAPARIGAAMADHAALVAALSLPILAVTAVSLVLGGRRERPAALAVGSAAVVLWIVGFNGNLAVYNYPFSRFTSEDWLHYGIVLRYAFAPAVFLVALLCLAGSALARRGRVRFVGWALTIGMAAVMVAGSLVAPPTSRAVGPDWESEIAAATARCATQPPGAAQQISASPSGWYATIPCARLGGAAHSERVGR